MIRWRVAFRLKIIAVVLAGLNAIWFQYGLHPKIDAPDETFPAITARTIALISLMLWTCVIVPGRMIAYDE